MFGIGPTELIVIGIVAVLLFGSRLPSVARSLGKSLSEFKKGMHDVEDEVKSAIHSEPAGHLSHDDRDEPAAPRFEPPPTVSRPSTADTPGQ